MYINLFAVKARVWFISSHPTSLNSLVLDHIKDLGPSSEFSSIIKF